MSARRSAHPTLSRRPVRPVVEPLEDRTAPAGLGAAAGASARDFTAVGDGYTPAELRIGYGINAIHFGTVTGDGTGQTIAIVDAFNDPTLYGDLDAFDQTFSLTGAGATIAQQYGPASSFLTLVNETGGGLLPAIDPTGGWEEELALDVEWTHVIAPGARIVVVEANTDQSMNDLFTAARTAAALPGVSVVSMSWGFAEFAGEQAYDGNFTTPSGHQGVTFLSATGDYGASSYPSYSPNVVAVGGTTLTLGPYGTYVGETAWGAGTATPQAGGTGGGVSQFAAEPAYQFGVQSEGRRTNPDVSFDGDPNTGVPVYDSFSDGASGPWVEEAGTSLGTPAWGALIAIANQGRALSGVPTLDGPSQTLPALYALPAADFHDVTSGSNGAFPASPGYDFVTGRGTPVANLLVPTLANFGIIDHLAVTAQPPASVSAGSPFGLQVTVERPNGTTDSAFYGPLTVSLATGPPGATLGGTLTVEAVAGVASFAGLTLGNPGAGYVLRVSNGSLTTTTGALNVVDSPPTHLVITAQPPAVVAAGSPFAVTVAAALANGAIAGSFSGVIALDVGANPGGATLGGPDLAVVSGGVAIFNGVTLNQAGVGYTLVASGAGLSAATSSPITVVAPTGVPNAPRLAPQSDTGVSATDGITRDDGSPAAPLVVTVGGVSPGGGYVYLYDETNPSAPTYLAGPVPALAGTATVTLAGTPLAAGTHRIAATAASTPTGAQSGLSPATTVRIDTGLLVTGISPANNFLTSLPNNQVVVSFNNRLAGLTPDVASGWGVAAQPFAVMLVPSGPDGPANQAATGSLWATPSGVDGGDLPVPATLVYHVNADGTSTVTLTPNQPLAADIYLIAVAGLTDLAGAALSGPVYSSFAYHPATSATPPRVVGVSADDGTIVIANDAIPQPDTIGVQFNTALDARTVNTGSVHLYAANGGASPTPIAAAVAYSPTNDTIYLTPEGTLNPGTVYDVAVDPSVSSTAAFPSPGQALGQEFATSFTVSQYPAGQGPAPLAVLGTSPPNGLPWNEPLGYVSVALSEPIALSSLGRFSAMLVPRTGGVTTGGTGYADVPLNAKLAFNPNTNQLIVVPTGILPNGAVYLVSLTGINGLNGGAPVDSTFVWNAPAAVPAHAAVVARDAAVPAGTAAVVSIPQPIASEPIGAAGAGSSGRPSGAPARRVSIRLATSPRRVPAGTRRAVKTAWPAEFPY